MSKVILGQLANLQQQTTAVNQINANSVTISTAFDNTLSRDGTAPNAMGSNLDMNQFQILNLPAPATINSPVRLVDVPSGTGVPIASVPPVGTSGAVVGLLNGNNTYSGTSTFTGINTYTSTQFFNVVPSYTLGSGLLAVNQLFSTNAIVIPASSNYNDIRFSQTSGANNTATVGAGSIYTALYSSVEALSGSDATSNCYGAILHSTNDGPGTCRGIHSGAFATTGSTGTIVGTLAQIAPVSTSSINSSAFATSLTSSGVNGVVGGLLLYSNGDQYSLGVGSTGPIPYSAAAFRAFMATSSAAGARAFQILNNAGTEIGFWHKDGSININSGVFLADASGNLTFNSITTTSPIKSSSPTVGIGYSTGAGGTVVQATSKSTGVTLNKISGSITMNSAALAGSTGVSFVLTNSTIGANDVVVTNIGAGSSGGTANTDYLISVSQVAVGSCQISIYNQGGSKSDTLVINFVVLKGVIS